MNANTFCKPAAFVSLLVVPALLLLFSCGNGGDDGDADGDDLENDDDITDSDAAEDETDTESEKEAECSSCSYCAQVGNYSYDDYGNLYGYGRIDCVVAACREDGTPECEEITDDKGIPTAFWTTGRNCTHYESLCPDKTISECSGEARSCCTCRTGGYMACDSIQYCNENTGEWRCVAGYNLEEYLDCF